MLRIKPSSNEASSFLTSLIQKCTSITTLTRARQLHALIITATSSPLNTQPPYLHNNLLSMYARCGSLDDAQKVFDKMPRRNIVSYNAIIAAYSRNPNCGFLAFKLNTQMRNEGLNLNPNGLTFTSLLQACCSIGDAVLGSLVHAHVFKFGFLDDVCVQTSLLGMYSNCCDLDSAKNVFEQVRDKDAVAWNSMIYGNLKNGKINESLNLFRAMVMSGINPTRFTYTMVLNAYSRLKNYICGKMLHTRMIVLKLRTDLPLQNAMVDMYCNCGDTVMAFNVFNRMENPDLISWNSMIAGCMENGYGEMAIHLFVQLQGLSLPKPDEYTFAAVISATGVSNCGKPLHGQVIKVGCETSVFVGTTLLSMYFKNGDSESAQKVFDSILDKDVVLWTEMIMGHCRIMESERAIGIFCEMCEHGYMSDSFSISGALSACADLPVLKQGEMIHSLALKTGNESEISVHGSLIDMYAKSGDLVSAQSIFYENPNPDLKCWNSLLAGYGHHGMTDAALKLFEEILKRGLSPDQVTFLSLLSACSHSGMVEKGKLFWNYMNENGISPGPKHYSCMVALLSRVGLLSEAKELIIKSTLGEMHIELWRTLLSSCVANRDLRTGVHAAEQILRLNPGDAATYILLCNLYAATGKYEAVAEMRRIIRGLMLEKDPGLSWIEVEKGVQVFSAGDQLHPKVDEAQIELERLKGNMARYNVELLGIQI